MIRSIRLFALACAVSLLATAGPALADQYEGLDNKGDACFAASLAHPHSCGRNDPAPFPYPSLDIRKVLYRSDGSQLTIEVTMEGAIPRDPPSTLLQVPLGNSALYRFFFTTDDDVQWCANLHIGPAGRAAPAPVWSEVWSFGQWRSGTDTCASRPLDRLVRCNQPSTAARPGSGTISGATVRWQIPYEAFCGAAGGSAEDLGGLTDIGWGTGAGVRLAFVDLQPSTLRFNADIGPNNCDPSGLHGGRCLGRVTL